MTYQLRSGFLWPGTMLSRATGGCADRTPSAAILSHLRQAVMDIFLVLVASLPVMAVVALLAVAVFVADRRNPFYLQDRIGRNGRVFRMWKLRTMVPDADRIFDAYLAANPEARAEWNRTQKLRHDPRVTRLGDVMRRTSLDELPQLWNVLKGDMSLVGPRPMMVSQKSLYPGPSITSCARRDRVLADLGSQSVEFFGTRYVRPPVLQALSFKTDVALILKTVKVVATGTGC